MRIAIILLLLWEVPLGCSCQQIPAGKGSAFPGKFFPLIETGVSRTLARYRFSALHNITYELSFNIPPAREQPVQASERLQFEWKNPGSTGKKRNSKKNVSVPLELDFRDSARAIQVLTVNNQPSPVELIHEHLLIKGSLLKTGTNTIEILFTAGNLSLNRSSDYLYTLLVPDRARTLFPCFDQPDLKALFTLSLDLPEDWKAVANAPLRDSLLEGDHKRFRYFPTDKIPTYLFSFAAGRFDECFRMADRPMHFYYRETDSSKLTMSLDSVYLIQSRAIRWLQNYTGIPYPFQKFDFVAIPDFQFGGMEHPGAILYRASSLFLHEGATRDQLIARTNLLSHETAHMWFGDLVTMRWFDDVWMKEVFANFMADKIAHSIHPDENSDLKFLTGHLPQAYNTDRTAGSNPIRQPLDNLQDAGSLYGNIIYHKAPVMLRQLERLMGADSFQRGVREYLNHYAYGNASWSELIKILGSHTSQDLEKWNRVWVENAGRPKFSYLLKHSTGRIDSLILFQKGEDGSHKVWPQFLKIALIYQDSIVEIPVHMSGDRILIRLAKGKPVPAHIIFNSGGEGYGLFPSDGSLMSEQVVRDPVMRASASINLYENMLDGHSIRPNQLLKDLIGRLTKEKEELNLGLQLEQLKSVFWRFLPDPERMASAPSLEDSLWSAMHQSHQPPPLKKLLFLAFSNLALDRVAQDTLYAIWKNQHPPENILLTEDDYTSLATGLAIRQYPGWKEILKEQLLRMKNPDNRQRLAFQLPSLSDNPEERDRFFYSLKDPRNRQKESWVLSALGSLFHPLRSDASEKYLPQMLELLEQVHTTGGVFFPENWLQTSLGYYHSPSSARIVRKFLKNHPAYNRRLKEKILQASDNLFRAVKLNREESRKQGK